jgi:putative aldouronate transport system substrate-binding protein
MSAGLSRRGLLSSAAIGALAVTGLPTLAACSGKKSAAAKGGGAVASSKLQLPTYVPAQVPVADLPGNADGLDAGYLRAPSGLTTSVATPPGDGKKITALSETFTTPAPAMGENAYWQELNKRLGSELDLTIVIDDYPSKFNALVASDSLPDLVWFPPNQGLQNVPQLLESKFMDLTPYLSGDAVKKYPNLANLPTYSWKTSVVNGKIYGVTVTYGAFGQVYLINEDFWKPVGGAQFSGADDFLAKAKTLVDAKNNKYVLEPAYYNHLQQFCRWFGAPNTWRLTDGKLKHQIETDELAAALEFATKVYQAGLFWPDPNLSTTPEKVAAGALGAYVQSFPGFILDSKTVDFPLGAIVPFAATSGAKPSFYHGYGSVGYTAINKKVGAARVETMLKVLNYLAAPFGTTEAEFINFGVEGTHFTRDGAGNPKLNSKGEAEVLTTWQPVSFLMNSPEYLYLPGHDDRTKLVHDVETKALAMMGTNPALGHYSDTDTNKGAALTKALRSGLEDIIAGRRPLGDLETLRKDWRSKGGDAMRGEYEKAVAAG